MRRLCLVPTIGIAILAAVGRAQPAATQGIYSVLKTAKVGGDGGFDYVYADVAGRRLYVPRSGASPRISVFDLDTFEPVGEIANTRAQGAAVDPKSGHGFASSKPVAMWDTKTLALLKSIDVKGSPDGILFDPFNDRVWVFSHSAPNVTVIDGSNGTIVGTLDLGGAPEQAVSDGKGHIYVDVADKDTVAVINTKTLRVTARYTLAGKGGTPAGLALDAKNHLLFVACRKPATMVILNADKGNIIATLPIGTGTDGAVFNPGTMEAFSSNSDGTLTIVKENSPTSFEVTQSLTTTRGAKTLTLDSKTNHVILIAAEYGAAPPQPPGGGRGGRPPMIPESFAILVVGK